jgi:hypothetical protein
MNQICRVFSLLLVIPFSIFVSIDAGAQYVLQDHDVTIDSRHYITACSYSFTITHIVIPDTLQGVPVKGIGLAAFQGKGITGLGLPSTLERIEGSAFRSNALTSVTFPASLTYLGRHSFRENNLTSVVVPNGVEFIGNETFKNNSITSVTLSSSLVYLGYQAFVDNQLTTISLPSSINYVGVQAFINNSITSFVLPNNTRPGFQFWLNSNGDTLNPATTVTNLTLSYTASIIHTLNDTDVVMEKGYITHCRFGIGTVLTIPAQLQGQAVIGVADREEQEAGVFSFMGILDVTLPNGIKYLGEYAFCDNSFYNSDITFPGSLEHIGYFAFYWSNIKSVVIPDAVTYIGELAFGWNPRLETLVLGNAVQYIGDYAFVRGGIVNLTIPNSVTHIGKYAFELNSITALTLGNSVTFIGQAAFNANSISSVVIPSSVVFIGKQAFRQNNLTSITLPAATKTGHTFQHWLDENNVSHNANASVTNFNIEYTAMFTVNNGTAIFNVSDQQGFLPGAEVVVGGLSYFTGYDGEVIVAGLADGTYPYLVKKAGFFDASGMVIILNGHDIINVTMSPLTYQTVEFVVNDNQGNPVNGATLGINNTTLTTDLYGHVVTQLVTGYTYAYVLGATGYLSDSGTVTIGTNDTVITLILPVDTTGIQGLQSKMQVALYPNPVQDLLHIRFGNLSEGNRTIEVVSIQGLIIQHHETSDQTLSIDMSQLPRGVYVVRIGDVQRRMESFRVVRK